MFLTVTPRAGHGEPTTPKSSFSVFDFIYEKCFKRLPLEFNSAHFGDFAQTGSQILKTVSTGSGNRKSQFEFIFLGFLVCTLYNHLVFRDYHITCHFRKIKTLGSAESAGIAGEKLFGSVTELIY